MQIFILFLSLLLASRIHWESTYSAESFVSIRPEDRKVSIVHRDGRRMVIRLENDQLIVDERPERSLLLVFRNEVSITIDSRLQKDDRVIVSTPRQMPVNVANLDTLLTELRNLDGVHLLGIIQ